MSENPMDGFGMPGPDQPEEAPARGRDPKLLIGGGIGLALIAVIGGYLFLGGGSSGSSAPTAAVVNHHVAPTTAAPTVLVVGKPSPAVKAFNGDVGRDPFVALITQTPPPVLKTSPAPKPTTPASAPAAPTAPGNVVGPPIVVTTLPSPGATSATPSPTPTSQQGVLVVLKAIEFPTPSTPAVLVSFGGKSYVLTTGQVASGSLKVMAIAPDDGTATFQLGDQMFDLHIGQSYVD